MSNDQPINYAMSLTKAKTWTANWRRWLLGKGVPQKEVVKGFFIPIFDILALANDPLLKSGARAYVALSADDDPSSIQLVLVSVDTAGKDMIEPLNGNEKGTNDEDEDYTIYDVTSPCPPFCDPESPLF